MSESNRDPLSYYALHGAITDPGEQAGLFEGLPTDISALCQVVQGLLIHVFWTAAYGVQLPKERESEVGIRHGGRMLRRVQELDGRPLAP